MCRSANLDDHPVEALGGAGGLPGPRGTRSLLRWDWAPSAPGVRPRVGGTGPESPPAPPSASTAWSTTVRRGGPRVLVVSVIRTQGGLPDDQECVSSAAGERRQCPPQPAQPVHRKVGERRADPTSAGGMGGPAL